MPDSPNRIRNVCNAEDEFPYCSRACAEHAYWQRDLPAFLDEFDKQNSALCVKAEPICEPVEGEGDGEEAHAKTPRREGEGSV